MKKGGTRSAVSRSLLMRFKEKDEHEVVTFIDALPPFGVLSIAAVTWEQLGSPDEVLVIVHPTSGAQAVAE